MRIFYAAGLRIWCKNDKLLIFIAKIWQANKQTAIEKQANNNNNIYFRLLRKRVLLCRRNNYPPPVLKFELGTDVRSEISTTTL